MLLSVSINFFKTCTLVFKDPSLSVPRVLSNTGIQLIFKKASARARLKSQHNVIILIHSENFSASFYMFYIPCHMVGKHWRKMWHDSKFTFLATCLKKYHINKQIFSVRHKTLINTDGGGGEGGGNVYIIQITSFLSPRYTSTILQHDFLRSGVGREPKVGDVPQYMGSKWAVSRSSRFGA
jgi:hypothetical protein